MRVLAGENAEEVKGRGVAICCCRVNECCLYLKSHKTKSDRVGRREKGFVSFGLGFSLNALKENFLKGRIMAEVGGSLKGIVAF